MAFFICGTEESTAFVDIIKVNGVKNNNEYIICKRKWWWTNDDRILILSELSHHGIKGLLHPKMKILSLITYPHGVPNQ